MPEAAERSFGVWLDQPLGIKSAPSVPGGRRVDLMETDPDQVPGEGENGDPEPDEGLPGQPTPEQERQAPEGGGGTTAPLPGNPDVGGS